MKQLTIISGKGGTGKTTITAAFASLAQGAVLADCDVDAADLHLIMAPDVKETKEFCGLKVARRDPDECIGCGKCLEHCRFEAIGPDHDVIPEKCEGCGVCVYICPTDAMTLIERTSGSVFISHTRFGPMAHARLYTAEEASGKLVSVVRNDARELAERTGRDLVIIDGPPGIGCPVIAAITGVDMVLVVTEPTVSGLHDLERVLERTGTTPVGEARAGAIGPNPSFSEVGQSGPAAFSERYKTPISLVLAVAMTCLALLTLFLLRRSRRRDSEQTTEQQPEKTDENSS